MAGSDRSPTRAVVAGASIAGLLSARVLADYWPEVWLVDRDVLPDIPASRKSVPQDRHAHALLAKGLEIIESLFPGLTRDSQSQGAIRGQARYFLGGGFHCDPPDAPTGLMVSRLLLENAIRRRVRALSNVRCLDNCVVTGPAFDDDRTRVSGVSIRSETGIETCAADLLVDATGRGSHMGAWLKSAGYPQPETELVEVRVGYATRQYRRNGDELSGAAALNIGPSSENRRAGGIFAQEGDRWIVSMAGYCGDHPPADEQGFLDFARSLPAPDIYNLISRATPLGPIVTHRFPANQRRHYERLSRLPNGLIAVGDTICSFTPIYGQGMTVAALEACALAAELAEGTDELPARFFRSASSIVDAAWMVTAGNDRRVVGAPQQYPARAVGWYMGKLQIAARKDRVVSAAFRRVAHMMAPPQSLLRPHIAYRVLWKNLRAASQPRPRDVEASSSELLHAPRRA